MTIINIPRRELYDKAWAMPLQKVADTLDCDYWRLRSAIIDAGIPVPPKGYWMKVAHGKPIPERPHLLDHPKGYKSVPLRVGIAAERSEIAAGRSLVREIAGSLGALKIPTRLVNPHPAVAEIAADPSRWPIYREMRAVLKEPPSECLRRVFRILNVIARAVESHGFSVAPGVDGGLIVSSDYRDTNIRVREKLRRAPISLPRASDRYVDLVKQRPSDGYQLQPSGFLEIQVYRGRWAEEPKNDLEDCLPHLIARLLADRERGKVEAASAAERARIRQIEERKRARAKKIADQEALAFAGFLEMSSRWTVTGQARTFLAAIRAADHSGANEPILEWLQDKIDAHDPLRAGPDPVLDKLAAIRNDIGEWCDLE
ncbi:hypothetical protein Amn_24090 [Aminobacter sp. Y103A]|nr:hypothetical protein Amn_24090 [Aminobacter sp. SS-2016]